MSTSYLNRLGEIDFSRTIERLAEGFTGREWLFAKLDHWLQQENGEQFYLLTGEPGVGKSAIAAQLTKRWADEEPETGKLAAYHFCRAGDVETVRPGRVLRSLATQLGKTLPHYGEALKQVLDQVHVRIDVNINIDRLSNSQVTGIYVENLKDLDPREEFRLLIQAPLAKLSNIYATLKETPPSLKVFLIDSLDEAATTTGQENMVTLLASLYQARETLPHWVRFLLTARPDQAVLNQFLPLQSEKIEELEDDNLSDIQLYIQGRVDEEIRGERSIPESPDNTAIANLKPLQQRLEEADHTAEKLIKEVKDLSHGNFLYTKLLLNSIASGEQSIKNLSALPKTLNDIYHRILRYRCSFRGWLKRYQPILGTLSVTQEPISQMQLSKFIGIKTEELTKNLAVFQQFLDESKDEQGQPLYTIFHQSLREYLLDRRHNHDFWCDVKEQHENIIECCEQESQNWRDLRTLDLYGLHHLAQHFVRAERVDELHNLLSLETINGHNSWFDAKENVNDVRGFLLDVDLALAQTYEQFINNPSKILGLQCRYVLITTSINSLTSGIPSELLPLLVQSNVWTGSKALNYAYQILDPIQKFDALISLTPSLLNESLQQLALQEALNVINKLEAIAFRDTESEATFFNQLLPKLEESFPTLSESLKKIALEIVWKVVDTQGNYLQEKVRSFFTTILPYLSETLVQACFSTALVSHKRCADFIPLVQCLNSSEQIRFWQELLKVEWATTRYSSALLNSLEDACKLGLPQVVKSNIYEQAATSLDQPSIEKALETTLNLPENQKSAGLIALIPHLSDSLRKEALPVTLAIGNDELRIWVLRHLAIYLQEDCYQLAWENIVSTKSKIRFSNKSLELRFLLEVACNAPEILKPQCFQDLINIFSCSGDQEKYEIAAEILAYLPDEWKRNIWVVTSASPGINLYLVNNLLLLIPLLQDTSRQEALDILLSVFERPTESQLLANLFLKLSKSFADSVTNIFIKNHDSIVEYFSESVFSFMAKGFSSPSASFNLVFSILKFLFLVLLLFLISAPAMLLFLGIKVGDFIFDIIGYDVDDITSYIKKNLFKFIAPAVNLLFGGFLKYKNFEDLCNIAAYLPETLKAIILDYVFQVKGIDRKAKLLKALFPNLSENQKQEVIRLILQYSNNFRRNSLLYDLLIHIHKSQKQEIIVGIFRLTLKSKKETDRIELLKKIIPVLPEFIHQELINGLTLVNNKSMQLDLLIHSFPHVSDSNRLMLLRLVGDTLEEKTRVETLKELIPYFSTYLQADFFGILEGVKDIQERAKLLHLLLESHPDKICNNVLKDILNAALSIQDYRIRLPILGSLLTKFPKLAEEEVLKLILSDASNIGDLNKREIIIQFLLDHNFHSQSVFQSIILSTKFFLGLRNGLTKYRFTRDPLIIEFFLKRLFRFNNYLSSPEERIKRLDVLEGLKQRLPETMSHKEVQDNLMKCKDHELMYMVLNPIRYLPSSFKIIALREHLKRLVEEGDNSSTAILSIGTAWKLGVVYISIELALLPVEDLYPLWCLVLRKNNISRSKYLEIISTLSKVIRKLGGEEGIREVTLAIQTVGRWWQ